MKVYKTIDPKTGKFVKHSIPLEACQYIGMKDHSGRDIWENDLINISAPGHSFDGITGVVVYDPVFASWCIGWDFEFGTIKAMITFQDIYDEKNVKIKVIGNIQKDGIRCPQDWFDELCRQEYARRMAELKKYEKLIKEDDLPF